jgi:hypothetical protein
VLHPSHVCRGSRRNVKPQQEQCHCHREHAVAQGRKPLGTLSNVRSLAQLLFVATRNEIKWAKKRSRHPACSLSPCLPFYTFN